MRIPDIRTAPAADIQIPVEFQGLYDMAYNLWWSWNPEAQRLFQRIDPVRWQLDHNPVELLINVEPNRWEGLVTDYDFIAAYQHVQDAFVQYMEAREFTWFHGRNPDFEGGPIAYFSTEYGWHECLSIYSGGLGILAGDHCKSASDLGLPFVGVGLLYRRGYFHQTIDADGHQQHHYVESDVRRLPILPVITPSGRPIQVEVMLGDRPVQLRLWKASVGRVPVILLDADLRENHPADRAITSVLYTRGREMRLCQEIVLGLGGVHALETLGITPSVWHLNEGHSALLILERVSQIMKADGVSFDAALARVRQRTVFTTHTPVPAGNESFSHELIMKYFGGSLERWGITEEQLAALGDAAGGNAGMFEAAVAAASTAMHRSPEEDAIGQLSTDAGGHAEAAADSQVSERSAVPGWPDFNLTALAVRSSSKVNGVSKMHGRVANDMWKHLGAPGDERVVGHVTNGVHVPSWIGPEMSELLAKYLGNDFLLGLDHPNFADTVRSIPNEDLWEAHLAQKRRLIHHTRGRVLEQHSRHGRSPDDLRQVDHLLDENVLTIGFARRFATYKRAALLFRDVDRLRSMMVDPERPIQLIFAGKAHPADRPGQTLIRDIFTYSQSSDFASRAVFLEDYNIYTARRLVQGVDLWLNTPRRPQEASGTSGMKAAINGVLNASILDGWWWEGFDASHGWAIGADREYEDNQQQDEDDADSLYRVLGDEVAPAFYAREEGSLISAAWVGRMKEALGSLTPRFNTSRMVQEYAEQYYLPTSEG